jgi:hypothetical protein
MVSVRDSRSAKVGPTVARAMGVHDLEVDQPVDLDLDVVARDAALGRDVDDLLAGLVAIGDTVEERDQEVEPGLERHPELAEALDDAHLAHRHNDHHLPDDEHRDQ